MNIFKSEKKYIQQDKKILLLEFARFCFPDEMSSKHFIPQRLPPEAPRRNSPSNNDITNMVNRIISYHLIIINHQLD